MSEASAAVYLADDSGHGETFLLADPGELKRDKMILTREDGGMLLVDREQFMGAGYRVHVDKPAPAERRRRRFGRKRGGK
jgi:hypothetical protein